MIKIWDRIKSKRTILLLFITSLIAIAAMEITAREYLKQRIQNIIETQKNEFRYRNDEQIIEFKNKYIDRLNHLRGPSSVRIKEKPPSELLFSVLKPFSKINNQNILIQGDSWADAAKFSQNFLKDFSERNHFGIVLGGVRSYSPSPMTIQLKILRDDFSIHPSIIIGIIDQTDIGDELFRYNHQEVDKSGELMSLLPEGTNQSVEAQLLESENNLISSKFALVKLLTHAILHFKSKFLNRKIPTVILGRQILSPLVNGVDIPSAEHFFYKMNRYIKTVFADQTTKYLILVTHPHRKHYVANKTDKRFKGEVGALVNQVIIKSIYQEKIIHIDFFKSENNKFLINNLVAAYIKNDPFSHLTQKMYSDYYYPFIFGKLKNL